MKLAQIADHDKTASGRDAFHKHKASMKLHSGDDIGKLRRSL